jgi:hypothetical protein
MEVLHCAIKRVVINGNITIVKIIFFIKCCFEFIFGQMYGISIFARHPPIIKLFRQRCRENDTWHVSPHAKKWKELSRWNAFGKTLSFIFLLNSKRKITFA